MATRYAGDVFNYSFAPASSSEESMLAKYFKDVRNIGSQLSKEETEGPRETGNFEAAPVFGGFKQMKKSNFAPIDVEFGGYKPMGY